MSEAGNGNTQGYAAHDSKGKLVPFNFDRRACGPKDVRIKITHSGICHSDVHQVRGEWGNSTYPMVPGHEIVGVVAEVGTEVTKVKVGDHAGVGCMVNSCKSCKECTRDEEQFCKGCVFTYNYKHPDGILEQGGYSTQIVTTQDFVLKLDARMPLDKSAPLLCAGITVFSPIRHYGLDKPGTRMGVVGLGGLGHMAVKFGVAMGCEVTVISTTADKEAEARRMGAKHFIVSKDAAQMTAAAGSLDGIIDTVSAKHDIPTYLGLLDSDGKLVMVGAPAEMLEFHAFGILFGRKQIGGSLIGGIKETQEMLDYCAEHNVYPDIEVIKMDEVNEAYDRLVAQKVRYRFVIDMEKSYK